MEFFVELSRSFHPSSDAFLFMWLIAACGVAAAIVAIERFAGLGRLTDYDALQLYDTVKNHIEAKRFDEAYAVCSAGGVRALPCIFAAGIKKARENIHMIADAMAEEATRATAALETRLNLLVMFSSVFTLFGLLGTVFGLIMSFDAVSHPDVAAMEKSALLAAGISTAMNSTLVGLSLSVLTVLVYAFLRARVDAATSEIDRYSMAVLNCLLPPDYTHKAPPAAFSRSREEEEVADADVTPMLNLMVILIPVLLTSSEFAKVGAIELKLPEAAQSNAAGSDIPQDAKLDAGIVITQKGFTVFSYFNAQASGEPVGEKEPDIPLKNGTYDFESLNRKLADIKKKALSEIVRSAGASVSGDASLASLYADYVAAPVAASVFADHESIKIVAEDNVKYETVVGVMDAARGVRYSDGSVTMFPNVSIAGGILH